jgi:hypothetical protein
LWGLEHYGKTGQRERGSRNIYIRTLDDYKFEMKYFLMLNSKHWEV